jgi:Ca2+-binding EF-hand superfamily protein
MAVMDDSGNKKLSREEFKYGMRDYGLRLSNRELDTVMKTFDTNKDGQVSFDEFLVALRGEMSEDRLDFVHEAFRRLDRTGDGVVTVEDLEQLYDVSQHPEVMNGNLSEREALKEFLSQWDTGVQDGVVTEEEFIDYYRSVSASVDKDSYFELMMRNAWHISGGTGQTANTANRRVLVTESNGRQRVVERDEVAAQWFGRKRSTSPTGSVRSVNSETMRNGREERRQNRSDAALKVQSHFRKLKGKQEHELERRKSAAKTQTQTEDSRTRRKERKRFVRPALRSTHGF